MIRLSPSAKVSALSLLLGVILRLVACQLYEQPKRPVYRSRVTKRTRHIRLQKYDIRTFLVGSVMLTLYSLGKIVFGTHLIVCIWSHKFSFLVWTRPWH